MNWKQLLKKHLTITKKNSLSFMITDHNRNSKLIELSDSIKPFNHEDFLVALSLQGQEKMVGFKEQKEPFVQNLETPYEQFIFTLNERKQWYRIIITRYNLINPLLGKEENILLSEHQGYIFQILKSDKENSSLYQSNLITPLDSNTGTVYYKNNPFFIKLKDDKKKELTVSFCKNVFVITLEKQKFEFKTKEQKPKISQSLLSFHFENISHKGYYYYINDKEITGAAEHIIYNYQTFLLKRIIYNFVHAIKTESLYKEIQFFLIFNKKEGLCIEIKKPTIEKDESFSVQSNGALFNTIIELKILEYNEQGLPTTWKVLYKNKVYYIKNNNNIHTIPFYILENEYFMPVNILTRNDSQEVGIGWLRLKNFEPEQKNIQRKLKKLYQPLERPKVENFSSSTFPIESILPTLFFLFFIIFIIVLSITTLVMFIILLSSSTTKTIDTPYSTINIIEQ